MKLQEAVELMQAFSPKAALFKPNRSSLSEKLESEKTCILPPELKLYVDTFCPKESVEFQGVGHPIILHGLNKLSWRMEGYNTDPATNNWHDDWFLIAQEGGEPIIVKLDGRSDQSIVYSAMQGQAGWEFFPIANSIAEFLVCGAAIERAMNFPGLEDSLDEAFNLLGDAAKWLFPFLRNHAGLYYEEWASVFENFEDY